MTRRLPCAAPVALLAMFATSDPADAATPPTLAEYEVSAFAVAIPDVGAPAAVLADVEPVVLATAFVPRRPPDRYHGDGYHHRGRGPSRASSQIHAGFLDPEGDPGFLLGIRGGTYVDRHAQIGVGLDWRTMSGRGLPVVAEAIGPGGELNVATYRINQYTSHLFPMSLYLQFSASPDLGMVPYVGASGSWQIMLVEGTDSVTGGWIDGSYDGFGWQVWGGAALRLSGRSRIATEVFLNQANLTRDLFDLTTGREIHETVSADGMGMRFGLNWGF